MKKKIVLVLCMIMLLIMSMALAVSCDNKDKTPADDDSGIIDNGGNNDSGNGGNNGGANNGGDNDNDEEILNERELVDLSQYLTYQVVGDDLSVKGLQADIKDAVSGVIYSDTQYIDNAKIIIPETFRGKQVIGVESEAFSGCIGLRSITIPDSVISIGFSAFSGCSNLTKMVIPFVGNAKDESSNTYFGYIFGASSYLYYDQYVPGSLKSITITGGENVGEYAFRGCSFLTSITIPNSVTSIGHGAFYGCSNLESMTIPFVGETRYGSINCFGYIFGADSVGENSFYVPSSLKRVTIIGGTIGDDVFSGCISLTSITIPESVTRIGDRAFSYCRSLTSITIPNRVTSIGKRAFDNCDNLTNIIVPDSVTSIGIYAFNACSSITNITFKGTSTQWNKIRKEDGWDLNTDDYTIYCTDGNISKYY